MYAYCTCEKFLGFWVIARAEAPLALSTLRAEAGEHPGYHGVHVASLPQPFTE